jgi:signal peptidase I
MEQTMDEQPTTIKTKPRNGFMAFLLSLFLPGLGQVYNGQPIKAAICFGLLLLIPLLFGVTRGTTFFYGLLSFFVIEIALRIYIIIDGVMNAKRQKEYVIKPYNTWYYSLLIAIAMIAILIAYDENAVLGTQTIANPTSSNAPTLQNGDWLIVDMKAYNNSEPDYGDIVVYSGLDGRTDAFRIVGRPNDTIELIGNSVKINGKESKSTFIKETTSEQVPVIEFEEELPNGHKHLVYKFKQPYDSTKISMKNIVVPSDSYYLLGDNRDNAMDSRYEGFISRDRIQGRIVYSYWGRTGIDRVNIDFTDK